MFVRVWEYRVHHEHFDAFERAYGPEGAWALLFARGRGYEGTRLLRDCSDESVFLTVDRWSNERQWDLFLARWKNEYDKLDQELSHLTVEDHDLLREPT